MRLRGAAWRLHAIRAVAVGQHAHPSRRDRRNAYLEEGKSWGAMFLMIFGGVFIAAGASTLALVLLAR